MTDGLLILVLMSGIFTLAFGLAALVSLGTAYDRAAIAKGPKVVAKRPTLIFVDLLLLALEFVPFVTALVSIARWSPPARVELLQKLRDDRTLRPPQRALRTRSWFLR